MKTLSFFLLPSANALMFRSITHFALAVFMVHLGSDGESVQSRQSCGVGLIWEE